MRVSQCQEQASHSSMSWPGPQCGEGSWASKEPLAQTWQPAFPLVAEVTEQQGEDGKQWKVVRGTCSGEGAVTVHFLKDPIEKSKEGKRRKIKETRNKKLTVAPAAPHSSPSQCTSVFKFPASLAVAGLCPEPWQGHRPPLCSSVCIHM